MTTSRESEPWVGVASVRLVLHTIDGLWLPKTRPLADGGKELRILSRGGRWRWLPAVGECGGSAWLVVEALM